MKCPFCRQVTTEVYNSRHTKYGSQTWRRRRCLNCGKSFTTYEAPDLSFLEITSPDAPVTKPKIKKAKQHYSRAKLFSSLYAAFYDIPHKDDTIDAVTDTIEAKILDLQQSQLTTDQIASLVLTTLKHFNTAAFLRYLSTHADLPTTADLKRQLKKY